MKTDKTFTDKRTSRAVTEGPTSSMEMGSHPTNQMNRTSASRRVPANPIHSSTTKDHLFSSEKKTDPNTLDFSPAPTLEEKSNPMNPVADRPNRVDSCIHTQTKDVATIEGHSSLSISTPTTIPSIYKRNGRRGGLLKFYGFGSMVGNCLRKIGVTVALVESMKQKSSEIYLAVVGFLTWIAICSGCWIKKDLPKLKKNKIEIMKQAIQRRETRKKSYRSGFSSLLVLVGMLSMVGVMFGAANACSGSTNPPTCDPLPDGNGEWGAAGRVGSLGGVIDDFLQDYRDDMSKTVSKPSNSMTTAEAIAKYGPIDTWDTSQVTNMKYVFFFKKNTNPDIRKWVVESVVDMESMFRSADSFNVDLSGWVVSSVTNMDSMFSGATAYTQVLCGNTWVESTATKSNMFGYQQPLQIATEICSCSPGKYLTTTTPKICTDCTNAGKYQDELGFTGSLCTKECSVGKYSPSGASNCNYEIDSCPIGTYSNEPASCVSCGAGKFNNQVGMTSVDSCISCRGHCCTGSTNPPICDLLPNGNGEYLAAKRAGSLGGVVDDLYQDYNGGIGNKPAGSMTTAQVISKHGPIGTWDTSQVTNMAKVFYEKININPDIQKWRVNSVMNMDSMFQYTDYFNIDLSSWVVSSVTNMDRMFYAATAYTQVLCGNTWIESVATKEDMFAWTGTIAKIATEICSCSPGQHLTTTSPQTCTNCPNAGKYQDEFGFKGSSCTKQCSVGKYSPSGASSCDFEINSCPIGTYSNEPASCVSCGAGKFNKQAGMTSIDSCSITCGGLFCCGSTNPPICDPLPNGNMRTSAIQRAVESNAEKKAGSLSLGGVVDDFFQDYVFCSATSCSASLSNKPSNSMSTAQVIAKFGPIETWDTSQVTNMNRVFNFKKGINPDIRNWIVDSVVDMYGMFQGTDSFNIDLSSWIVTSVTGSATDGGMNFMFKEATAYTQVLCGETWVESTAPKMNMFLYSTESAKIGTEICACHFGKHLTTTTTKTCSECTDGKYQDERGFAGTSCTKKCSVGKYSNVPGTKTDNDCKLCSSGRWSNQVGLVSDDECIGCVGGRYSTEEGQSSIDTCLACAAGTYSTAGEGQSSVAVCNNKCSKGKWSNQTGRTSNDDCTDCVAGRYSDKTEDGQTTIDACNNECAAGTWSDLPGSTTPCNKLCSKGKFSSTTGLSSDNQCEGKCSIGKYSTLLGLISDNDCQPCLEGKWSNQVGLMISSDCTLCTNGRYSTETGRATACKACPFGYRQPDKGKTFCFPCVPGEFQNVEGSIDCKPCPANTFSGQANQKECSLVDVGHYRSGPTTQQSCEAGMYSKVVGNCKHCGFGQYRQSKKTNEWKFMITPQNIVASAGVEVTQTVPDGIITGLLQTALTGEDTKSMVVTGTTGGSFISTTDIVIGAGDTATTVAHTAITTVANTPTDPTTCVDCPAGWSAETGSTKCQACEAGTFNNETKKGCRDCIIGQYRPSKDEDGIATDLTKCK